jgi:uncharacterized protein
VSTEAPGPTDRLLPAREGIAVPLRAGERLRITNHEGGQVVDMWALAAEDPSEYLSMAHTRVALLRLVPRTGDGLYSSHRRPLLTLVEDTSPGVHDTLIPSCDPERYRLLGAEPEHASCVENFHRALAALGVEVDRAPSPLNLFMNVAWLQDGALAFLPSPAQAGDYVTLRAEADVTVVLSACPQDMNPINAGGPRDVRLSVLAAEPA